MGGSVIGEEDDRELFKNFDQISGAACASKIRFWFFLATGKN
jgi:hypothetical protein